jgi:hypothetical protein
MSANFVCSFCGYTATTKSNLKSHQAKTMYCLEIQHGKVKSSIHVEDDVEDHKCVWCENSYAHKTSLVRHQKLCKAKDSQQRVKDAITPYMLKIVELEATIRSKDQQIIQLSEQVSELQKAHQAVAMSAVSRPTSVKTNIKNLQVNNLTPLLTEEMRSHLPMLTHEHINAGAAGLAKYAVDYPLKDKVIIADASRRKIKWKNETGAIVEDLEGVELCKKFFEVHREASREKISELMREVMKNHEEAIDADDTEAIKICDERICKLHDLRRGILRLSRGDTDELRADFVKEVCVKLVPG